METNQVHLEEEDRIDQQEMEREKALVLKGRKVSSKKINQNQLAIQITQNTLEKKPSEDSSKDSEKKSFGFKGRKKFKNRNNRPKSFTFKKHSQKRAKI